MTYNLKRSLAGLALAVAVASAVALTLSLALGARERRLNAPHSLVADESDQLDPNDCSRGIDESNQETCDGAVAQ